MVNQNHARLSIVRNTWETNTKEMVFTTHLWSFDILVLCVRPLLLLLWFFHIFCCFGIERVGRIISGICRVLYGTMTENKMQLTISNELIKFIVILQFSQRNSISEMFWISSVSPAHQINKAHLVWCCWTANCIGRNLSPMIIMMIIISMMRRNDGNNNVTSRSQFQN